MRNFIERRRPTINVNVPVCCDAATEPTPEPTPELTTNPCEGFARLESLVDHIQTKFNITDEVPDEDTVLEVLNSKEVQDLLKDREVQLMIAQAITGGMF